MRPGQKAVENQRLDLESESQAHENQNLQPRRRHLELLEEIAWACDIGSSSERMVGTSSETVGCMCMAR